MEAILPFLFAIVPGLGIALVALCISNHSTPIGLFTSCVSNKEFNALLETIFTDPKVNYDNYNVFTPEYKVWYCNGHFAFNINDVKNFSWYQKRLFYKRFKQWRIHKLNGGMTTLEKQRSKLNVHKLTPAGQVLYGGKK